MPCKHGLPLFMHGKQNNFHHDITYHLKRMYNKKHFALSTLIVKYEKRDIYLSIHDLS